MTSPFSSDKNSKSYPTELGFDVDAKQVIAEPRVGQLGEFWCTENNLHVKGELAGLTASWYTDEMGLHWQHFRPFTKAELERFIKKAPGQ